MTLIDDYLDEQIKYERKYGMNTIVLMQVGHFYEAYAINNNQEKTNSENMIRLADIMNIQMTRKNKSIVGNGRGNPLMIGVNIYSIDKYIQMLLNANYTIVLISQTSEAPYVKREVTNIYSPGTNIEYSIKGTTNNLVSVFIEEVKHSDNNNILFIGATTIDLSVGNNTIFEIHSKINDKNYALDELFRFIQVYDPKELIIIKKNVQITNETLSNYLELNNRIVHYKEISEINKHYFNINYQRQFLERIFKKNPGLLSVIEYLDLETKPFGLISYIFLLNFAYEHNAKIIEKINKPEIWHSDKYLCLANNTINQLNLVDHAMQNVNCKYSSLFAVLDNTSTNIGKRYLRNNLLNPIVDVNELNKRYNIVEELIKHPENDNLPLFNFYENYLCKISDLEKLHRKLSLNLLQPAHFSSLDISYENVLKLLDYDNNIINSIKPSMNDINIFKDFIKEYRSHFDLNEIVKYHLDKINSSFFKENVCEKIDNMQENINKSKKIFNTLIDELSKYVDEKSRGKSLIKLDYTERDGYYLVMTSKRAKSLKDNLTKKKLQLKIDSEIIDTTLFNFKNHAKSVCKIECDYLKNLSKTLVKCNDKIHDLCKNKFMELCEKYETKYGAHLKSITSFIGNIDMYKSIAKVSCKYGYSKPIINEHEKSYIDFEEIRHPIIERINSDINYVTNNIKLGEDNFGLLLFGTNASGKSSLMKAIGLNVIMAQSGFFVSAKKFKFKPYKNIFTRINNNDNIFKGESSFAVEMSELRSILNRTCENSLVLGDELCSGTESISALSIFSSSVVKLNEKKTTFIFATHLHELCKIKQVTTLDTIKFMHLKVVYNEDTGELIYDRKLQEGNGQAIYGLEVCKAMDMDSDFLKLSETIRKDLLGVKQQILETKQSKYNSEVYIHNCIICNENAEDVHHIKFQSSANENDIIDDYLVKNNKSNLVPLCKKCHNEVHNGRLEIQGYKKTSEGVLLDYNYIEESNFLEKKNKKKKFDDNQITIIRDIYSTHKTSKKDMCLYLEKNHNIKISVSTFNKIINNEY